MIFLNLNVENLNGSKTKRFIKVSRVFLQKEFGGTHPTKSGVK